MRALLAAAAAAVVCLPAVARAECAMPTAAMFPIGDQVPPMPTLYRFELPWKAAEPLRVEGPHGPVPFEARDVSTSEDVRVIRIDVHAARGWFTVRGDEYEVPRRFEVTKDAPRSAPELQGIEWLDDAWTCSYTLGLAVSVRAAGVVAYRVSWGAHEELVPPLDSAFFRHAMGGEIDPAQNRVFLGHPSCVASLIDDAYIGRKDFDLFAIYADGTEQEVQLPRAKAEPPPPPRFVRGTPRVVAHEERVAPEAARRRFGMAAAAGGVGAFITIILVLLVRRRRTVVVP